MVSKNNSQNRIQQEAKRVPHYGLRKLSVGVASVLLGTSFYFGTATTVHAATDKPAVAGAEQVSTDDQVQKQNNSSSQNLELKWGGTGNSNNSQTHETVHNDTVSGKTDQTVESNSKVPAGWEIDGDAKVPETTGDHTPDTIIPIKHKEITVDPKTDPNNKDVQQNVIAGDTNASGNKDSQTSHKATSLNTESNKFELTSTITNNTDHDDKNIFAVTVLPNTQDGKSQFDTHLTGPVEVEGADNAENVTNWYVTGEIGKKLDTLLTKDKDGNYEPTKAALEAAIPEGSPKVTRVWSKKPDNWNQVTAVITTVDSLKAKSSLKIHLHTYDPSVETDIGKTAYMSQAVMDSTSFKKLRTGRTIKFVTADNKPLGEQDQPINDVAIYHTNAVTGDIVGDVVLEKGLPEVEFLTFDGYKITSISGGNHKFWQDYDPENPTKILPVTVIKNLQDAKTNKVSGYASILRETITVTYQKTAEHTDVMAGGGNTNALALFSMLASVPQTPDKVEQHTSIINAGDSNSAKLTVVGKQKINISYIDDTEGKQLGQTDSVEGLPSETAAYSTADRINEYKKQGYDLVSDGTKSQEGQSTLIYDNDYQTDQNFEVHLKHDTKPVDDDSTVTETIHYIYKDGATASRDKVQTISFKRTGTKDLVTQDVNWNPVDPQTFAKVKSPEITGYTPNVAAINAITVNFGHHNIEKTVTYTANDQNAKITYIDDTTGKSLKSESAAGKFGELIEFPTDVDTQIKDYEDKGYEKVSDNFAYNKYQADNAKNVFEVHLKHVYTTPEITVRHATWTINYVGCDDHDPESNQQKVTFTRTVYTDKVTNEVHDSGYVPDKQFKDVNSPAVDGYSLYKPDKNAVVHQDTKLGENDSDATYVTIVPYLKDQPGTDLPDPMESRQSTWTIHYVGLDKNPDDVVQTVHFIKKGNKFVPTTSFKDIDSPKAEGYDVDIKTAHQDTVLGENNTNGKFETTVIYTKPNEFVDTDTPVESHRATLTINYVGTDNNPKSVVQTVYFVKKGDKFVPTSNFEDVVSPEINGYSLYNPDKFAKVHQDTKLGENDSDIDYVITVPYVKEAAGTDLPDPMESRQSTWTIHYVGLDKNPDDVVQTVHFIKKGDKFVPTTNFKDIISPKVEGYDVDIKTAHQDTVLGENNTNGKFETTVIYTKPNEFVDVPAKIADKNGIPGKPLEQPELPKFEGGIPGIPLEQPDKPIAEIGIPGEPLEQPDKPIAEIGIPGEPLEQPDKPIAEIGIPGEPLEQPGKPIAKIGIPGEPLEQPDKPIAEIGIPGKPLEQPDKPIAEIGIPGEPLEQPELPAAPVPNTDVPSIPTPNTDVPNVPTPNVDVPNTPTPKITTSNVPTPKTDTPKISAPVVHKVVNNYVPHQKVVKVRKQRTLPQTGSKNTALVSAIGILMSGVALIGLAKRKRQN